MPLSIASRCLPKSGHTVSFLTAAPKGSWPRMGSRFAVYISHNLNYVKYGKLQFRHIPFVAREAVLRAFVLFMAYESGKSFSGLTMNFTRNNLTPKARENGLPCPPP